MTKTLTYSSFVIALILVILVFVTSTTYVQLGIGIVLYPILAFFGYKIFLNTPISVKKVASVEVETAKVQTEAHETVEITDINKRSFLKLLGATGISFFIVSLFGRRVESLLFGGQQETATTPNIQTSPTPSASATDGYNISEIDDNIVSYYGFINQDGGWFIMKGDADSGSFRYSRGSSKFPNGWKNRDKLKYDYFYKVFLGA